MTISFNTFTLRFYILAYYSRDITFHGSSLTLALYFHRRYDTYEVTGTGAMQHIQTGLFTTRPKFDSNFTLEKGSNDNALLKHAEDPEFVG